MLSAYVPVRVWNGNKGQLVDCILKITFFWHHTTTWQKKKNEKKKQANVNDPDTNWD